MSSLFQGKIINVEYKTSQSCKAGIKLKFFFRIINSCNYKEIVLFWLDYKVIKLLKIT